MLHALDSCVCSPQSWRWPAISRRLPLQQPRPRLRLRSLPPLPQLLRPRLRLQPRPRRPQRLRLRRHRRRRVAPEEPSVVLLSIVVAPVPDAIPEYDRGEWRHWTDEDGDCQDARQEALVAESVSPVVYTSSDRCRVASGAWVGPYTGEQFTDPGTVGHRPHGAPRQRPSVRRLGLELRAEAPVRQRPLLRQPPDCGAGVRQPREGQQEPCGMEAAGPRLLVSVRRGLDSHQEHVGAHRD